MTATKWDGARDSADVRGEGSDTPVRRNRFHSFDALTRINLNSTAWPPGHAERNRFVPPTNLSPD